ncbi:Phospholipid-binding protein [hydrothermal vent metagenome]|uniref:Phospholipid-binding protein n=1 Tax=hydrothermal vent metagenome TaxID=652676 RepID=A0A3B0XN65_9ZZZZ
MKPLIHIILLMIITSSQSMADSFKLFSKDINNGAHMPKAQEFMGFGCNGDNLSPQLSWSGAPEGTKSFAITAYDPDAPTGSGWWHWQIVNINRNTTELARGAGDIKKNIAPEKSLQIENDYGTPGFGGACPPKASKAHRYQFTVYALKTDKLNVTAKSSGALVGYMVKSNALASATIEALYKR